VWSELGSGHTPAQARALAGVNEDA
jgi:hypothetical protein